MAARVFFQPAACPITHSSSPTQISSDVLFLLQLLTKKYFIQGRRKKGHGDTASTEDATGAGEENGAFLGIRKVWDCTELKIQKRNMN